MIRWLLRQWRAQFPPEKAVSAWAAISKLPDPPEMFHADGRNKRARVTRFPQADTAKLHLPSKSDTRGTVVPFKREAR